MWTLIPIVLSALMLALMLADFAYRHVIPEGEHRDRFHSWLKAWASRAGTVAAVLRRKLILAAGLAGACVVVWASFSAVVAFSVSEAPISRREIIQLLMNAFNLVAYGVTGTVLVGVLFAKPKAPRTGEHKHSGRLVLSRKEGESIHISVAPGTDAEQLLQDLQVAGITFHIGVVNGGQVKVAIETPKVLQILRGELVRRDDRSI